MLPLPQVANWQDFSKQTSEAAARGGRAREGLPTPTPQPPPSRVWPQPHLTLKSPAHSVPGPVCLCTLHQVRRAQAWGNRILRRDRSLGRNPSLLRVGT